MSLNPPLFKQHGLGTQFFDKPQTVRGDNEDVRAIDEAFHAPSGLFQEMRVAHADPLVYQQYFWIDACRDREGKAQQHTARLGPHRHGKVLAELGEGRDFVGPAADLPRA